MQGTAYPTDRGACAYAGHSYYSSTPEADQKPPSDGSFLYAERSRSPISIDAPTQHRNYVVPSATSRKDIPAHIIKQLNRCPVFHNTMAKSSEDDEHDQLTEEGSSAVDPELLQQIMDKRRRNTLSARRSRQKRIRQLQDLEQERNELLKLVHDYRNYIIQVQEYLKAHGIICELPPFCQ